MVKPLSLQSRSVGYSGSSPFDLGNALAYRRWRDAKLEGYPRDLEKLFVEINNPDRLTPIETHEIVRLCRKTNMVIYAVPASVAADRDIPRKLGAQLGLAHLDGNMLADDDGVTSLQVVPGKSGRGYIPYSNERLLWHTDGYYNAPERSIRAFILHCARPAAAGGENELLDHEMAYLLLRDTNPEFIRALMTPDAMTIPANSEAGEGVRPAQSGPVFSVDSSGNLHMRYTARTRSIEWKPDTVVQEAVRCLERLLTNDSPYIFHHRLEAGQGMLTNNVLHNRTKFMDDMDKGQARLIYRARYYDRISGTDLDVVSLR